MENPVYIEKHMKRYKKLIKTGIILLIVAVLIAIVSLPLGLALDALMYEAYRSSAEAAGETIKGHGAPALFTIIGFFLTVPCAPVIFIIGLVNLIRGCVKKSQKVSAT